MCIPASFILTKDREFWSKKTNSHEEIIREYNLCAEVAGKICILRCEITPPEGNTGPRFDAPHSEWIYKTDHNLDSLPEWFNASDAEKRCRDALNKWCAARVFINKTVEVRDVFAFAFNSKVTARDSSTVEAWGSSTVTALDSSTVEAYDSSTVTARGSSTVTARGSSTVTAWDSSTVEAYDSSTVTARSSSTVTARDSSTVTAWDSSTVKARGSSTVEAWGSSTVTACEDRATVSFYCAFSCVLKGSLAVVINRIGAKAWCYVGTEKERTVKGE